MSAGWVAAAVRGKGLARRRLEPDVLTSLAASRSLAEALAILARTPYGREVRPDMDLATAQWAITATLVWHLRILLGWSPPLRSRPLREVTAGFEIGNVVGHLARMNGQPAPASLTLGSLGTAWTALSRSQSPAELHAALRSSVWGDPGGDDPATVRLALQLRWARRVLDGAPAAADWAVSGTTLILARVLATDALSTLGRSARLDITYVLGPRWQHATSFAELPGLLPLAVGRLLRDVDGADDLWRAEARWWAALESGGAALMAHPLSDSSSSIGVAALLAVDAWRARAAIAIAAHGGGALEEVFDGVA